MKPGVINLLRREERKARLRFEKMLALVSSSADIACPFNVEPPQNAIALGIMPKYLRGAFLRAYELRSAERQSEAEVFEEAISDLIQVHFKKILTARAKKNEVPIGQFRIGKDWQVYALPL